jgi:hypothetical protein
MYRDFAVALCLVAALAMIGGAFRALYGSARGASRLGKVPQSPLEHCMGASRFAAGIMFGTTNTPCVVHKGWSLIDRSSRARRAVRLAVR